VAINAGITNALAPALDVRGAVLDIFSFNPDNKRPIAITSYDDTTAEYIGNVVTNAQAIVAKAVIQGLFNASLTTLSVKRNTINGPLLAWIEAAPGTPEAKLSAYTSTVGPYICNGDIMFHVIKGVIAFKMDGAVNVTMIACVAERIENIGIIGSTRCPYDTTTISHPLATTGGYEGANVRGFTFSGSKSVTVQSGRAEKISSEFGSAIGFDVLTDSQNVVLRSCVSDEIHAGVKAEKINYNGNPTTDPESIGFQSDSRTRQVSFIEYCVNALTSITERNVFSVKIGPNTVSTRDKNCNTNDDEPWWVWLIIAIAAIIFIFAIAVIAKTLLTKSKPSDKYVEMK